MKKRGATCSLHRRHIPGAKYKNYEERFRCFRLRNSPLSMIRWFTFIFTAQNSLWCRYVLFSFRNISPMMLWCQTSTVAGVTLNGTFWNLDKNGRDITGDIANAFSFKKNLMFWWKKSRVFILNNQGDSTSAKVGLAPNGLQPLPGSILPNSLMNMCVPRHQNVNVPSHVVTGVESTLSPLIICWWHMIMIVMIIMSISYT